MPKRKPLIVKERKEVSSFFGVADRTFSYWQTAGCPGENGNYDLYEIVSWWAQEIVGPKEIAKADKVRDSEEKDIDSELKRERLRQELRAKELDYAERISELLPRQHVRQMLQGVAHELRKCGELLRKQYGDDAQQLMLEHLDSAERVIAEQFDDSDS